MKEIEFKSGIYVIEIKNDGSFIGYIKAFRKRPLGYSYEVTKDIYKAYRWRNILACSIFHKKFETNRIEIFCKNLTFKMKEVDVDVKLKRKIKLDQIKKFKPWYNREK